ncbi:uncharacterized protein BJ171DRAFT_420902 [Polychytrium aggregatum]|uniref:uncharacterized protein n=1 Tax=Polychytrium aggregatum TaxID=110093 RepID=UPI0022FDC06D|nr:uncharacterized protein BJ171DRAFT_420902 [Polychytrium aggregatum]KAI9207131.1 hypothetical protein BJ171DRAFT_420902 [Polychytrium aggregatum]
MRLFWTAGVAACLLATVQHADAFCQTPGACFPLAANNICGSSFVGYGINSLYFDEFPATGVNTDTFNQVMIQRYETISVVADNFISNKGCSASASSFISQNFRYQLSFWCSVIIRDNIMQSSCSCPPPAGSPVHGPALCTAQCQIATASVQSLLNDPTACPATSNTTQSQGRTTTLGTFQTYCSTTAPADLATPNGGPCYAGVDQDVQFCGDTTTATATATATASSTTTPISPTGAASPTASPTPASSGGSSINLPVILGSVGGALVLCAIVAVVLVRRRHNSSTSDGNYKVLNAAGHRPAPSGTQLMPMSGHASPANARSVAGPAGLQPSYVPPHINTTAPYTPPPASLPSSNRDSDSLFTPLTSVIAGQLVTAIHPYESQLGDELPLTQGQNIKVLRSFDDGWALGQIIETGRQGAFPIVCVCSTEQYPKIVQALQAASPSISGSDIAGHTPSLPDTNHVSSRVSSMILTPTDSLPGH